MSVLVALIGEAAQDAWASQEYLAWIAETFGVALTVGGFALYVLFSGGLSLYNWSESFKVPVIWLVLMTPLVATLLPVPALWRLVGLITTAVAALFVGLWLYWRRV